MKNQFIKISLSLLIAITALNACKKNDPEAAQPTTRLVKMTSWTPSNNNESVIFDGLTYSNEGVLTGGKTSNNGAFTVTYTANQASKIEIAYADGRKAAYELQYTGDKVTKNIQTSIGANGATALTTTHVYEYNAAGKLAKRTSTTAGGNITVSQYTWSGENISEYSYVNNSSNTTYTYKYKYDDKINPFYGGGNALEFAIYGSPVTKNNATEINIVYTGFNGTQKRIYTYNEDGYATSMKLDDASNEGNKYYYNK